MAKKQSSEKAAKSNPFQHVVRNVQFHNFDNEPEVTGLFVETATFGEDSTKPFDAHILADFRTGEEKAVSSSYAINKAIEKAVEKFNGKQFVLKIKFNGKTAIGNGSKQFNQFDVSACSIDEYQAYIDNEEQE